MLMTVLKGDLAVRQSKALIRIFKKMKDYMMNQGLIGENDFLHLSMQVTQNALVTADVKDNLKGVEITIYTDNLSKELTKALFEDFRKEYPDMNIKLYKSGGVFHDRYIALDYGTDRERIFLCGASSKDGGRRISSILEDKDKEKYHNMFDNVAKNAKNLWRSI